MANLKPQSPLTYMDDYIFPLTSADQVIIDEQGHRLDSVLGDMLRVEEIASSGGGVSVDAASVQGKTVQDIYNTLYPVGSIYTSSTATNQSSSLGFGTWKLVGKQFIDTAEYDNSANTFFTPNATNTTSAAVVCIRSGTTLTVRLQINNKVAIGTTELVMGTFNWEAMGISGLSYDLFYFLGGSVDGDDAFLYRVYKNGDVHIWKYINSSIAANKNCYTSFTVTVPYTKMLDSACDKFHWKRTA